ncbi:conserved hypothetical protein [Ahrensia sp. R2A130]|nr:conserved hypothetical protein [Ahrensia sp. R2A130]
MHDLAKDCSAEAICDRDFSELVRSSFNVLRYSKEPSSVPATTF